MSENIQFNLEEKFTTLENEVNNWREKRENLNSQVIDLAKERNSLNLKVKGLITKGNESKNDRDELNARLKELKEKKKALYRELEVADSQRNQSGKETSESEDPSSRKRIIPSRSLKHEIKDLEWKIQTTPNMKLEDERRLQERIANLEVQLEDSIIFEKERREKQSQNKEYQELFRVIHSIEKEMYGLFKESRERHKEMITSFKEANVIKKNADRVHAKIQEIKAKADDVHRKYVERIKEKRKLSKEIRKTYGDIPVILVASKKTKKSADDALEKTKDGKRISFNEFKNMINHGLI